MARWSTTERWRRKDEKAREKNKTDIGYTQSYIQRIRNKERLNHRNRIVQILFANRICATSVRSAMEPDRCPMPNGIHSLLILCTFLFVRIFETSLSFHLFDLFSSCLRILFAWPVRHDNGKAPLLAELFVLDFISDQPQHWCEFSGSAQRGNHFSCSEQFLSVSRVMYFILFSCFCSAGSFADVCALCVRSQIRFSPSYPQQFCWQRTQIKLIHTLQWANTCDCVALLRTQITSNGWLRFAHPKLCRLETCDDHTVHVCRARSNSVDFIRHEKMYSDSEKWAKKWPEFNWQRWHVHVLEINLRAELTEPKFYKSYFITIKYIEYYFATHSLATSIWATHIISLKIL